MATVKRQTNSQKKASQKKVTKSYTTTSGVKVTKYSDGTEKRTGGSSSSSSSSGPSSSPSSSSSSSKALPYDTNALLAQSAQMLAQTKAEGSASFRGSSYDTGGLGAVAANSTQPLVRPVAPTNAGLIPPPLAETTIPDVSPVVGDIASAVAGAAGLSVENQKLADLQAKQDEQRIKLEEQRQKENKSLMEKFLGNMTSPSEARQDAWDETGMDVQKYFAKQEAGIKEIESLTNDYNNVMAQRDQQIAQTQDAMGSMNFINNQTAQIERNAAPQLNRLSADINAKAATLQAQQGNYAEARAYVNDAVTAATADSKFKFDMYSTFYEVNQDNFDRIDSIYSDSYKNQMAIAQQEYEADLAEKQMIGEYMLKYPTAGLKMTDSIEEASKKIGSVSGGTVDLTADQKNYEYAVSQGYEGTFADFIGKGSVDTNSVDGLAVALFNGQIGIGDVPSEKRNEVLRLYNEMLAIDEQTKATETTASGGRTATYTAPAGTYSTSPVRTQVPVTNTPSTGATYSGPGTTTATQAVWGQLFGS